MEIFWVHQTSNRIIYKWLWQMVLSPQNYIKLRLVYSFYQTNVINDKFFPFLVPYFGISFDRQEYTKWQTHTPRTPSTHAPHTDVAKASLSKVVLVFYFLGGDRWDYADNDCCFNYRWAWNFILLRFILLGRRPWKLTIRHSNNWRVYGVCDGCWAYDLVVLLRLLQVWLSGQDDSLVI